MNSWVSAMKKIGLLIMIILFSSVLYGCPPEDYELPEYLWNYELESKIVINLWDYYEDEDDVIVFSVDQPIYAYDNFYIKATSFDILGGFAFGYPLVETLINNEVYYGVDFEQVTLEENLSFYLFLKVDHDSIFDNLAYDEFLKSIVAIQSMQIILNYNNSNTDLEMHEYRFHVLENQLDEHRPEYRFEIYNNIDDVLEHTVFNSLYLPFNSDQLYPINPEIIYYPYYRDLFINSEYFSLRIRESDFPGVYGDQVKNYYTINGIEFTTIKLNINYYAIDFSVVLNERTVQYSYMVKMSVSELRPFMESISEISQPN